MNDKLSINLHVIKFAWFLAGCLINSQALATDIIEQANLYTVKIMTTITYPFGEDKKGSSIGAGFLINKEKGWILTNAHVASKSPSIVHLHFKNEQEIFAEKVYLDQNLDLAILKVQPDKIPAFATEAQMKCQTEPQVGMAVIAFGHPWSLDYTATRGIISGSRSIEGEEVLQTDAALNPGNSGGPLIEAATGSVVGINSAKFEAASTEGMNFAVPSHLACVVINLLNQGKDPSPPLLPFSFATSVNTKELIVAESRGSLAEVLKSGDRILSLNGDSDIYTESRFLNHLRNTENVEIKINRNGSIIIKTISLPAQKDIVFRRGIYVSGMVIGPPTLKNLSPEILCIQFIEPASLAEQALIEEADQIVSLDGQKISDLAEAISVLKNKEGKEINIILKRPKFSLLSGRYELYLRQIIVSSIFKIEETGNNKELNSLSVPTLSQR